jgi:uncharacterized protein
MRRKMKKIFNIEGMHCNACPRLIEEELKGSVKSVKASYAKGTAEIDYDEKKISEKEIVKKINGLGYSVVKDSRTGKKPSDWFSIALIAVIVTFVLYALFIGFDFGMSGIKMPVAGSHLDLILLLVAGLLTGFHCVSMCGGFIVSYTTKNALNGNKGFAQHAVYGISKTFSYALIGGVFGLIGGALSFNSKIRGIIAIIAGMFMIAYAFSMFGIAFFRRFQLNPKFLTRIASKNPKGAYVGPLVTGLLTGLFIACGPLQAMYLYAIGSGSFRTGAISLAIFGLGTLPVLLGFGSLVTMISHKTTAKILKVSAIIVLLLGVIMINTGLALTGSSYDLQSLKARLFSASNQATIVNGTQEINMTIDGTNWDPKVFVLKKGVPVKWIIDAKKLPCDTEIYVNDYGLDIKLKTGINIVEFTPNQTGSVKWACWMGMISGNFIVTETGTASKEELVNAAPSCTGMCNETHNSPNLIPEAFRQKK